MSQIGIYWHHGLPDSSIPESVDVFIAGGGPVASALAVELGTRGVQALAFEREPRLFGKDVRARSLSPRSMEHIRRWQLQDTVHANATIPPEWRSQGFTFVTSLAGHVLHQSEPPREAQWRGISAASQFGIPQYVLTAILRRRAHELGNPVYTGWEAAGFEPQEAGVRVTLRNVESGAQRHIFARYVVGADGGRSFVRESQGITRTETPVRNIRFNVGVRLPDVFEQIGRTPHGQFSLFGSLAQSVFCPFDTGRWGFNAGPFPEGTKPEDVDFVQEARNRVGKDVPVEIDAVSSYTVQKRIADRFRQGRFLLAGDAAHLFPPFLGHNLNTGLEDVANLGWKLEAVLKGWGSDGLLDAYHEERHFIAHRVADETLRRADQEDEDRAFVQNHPVDDADTSEQAEETRQLLAQYLRERLPRRGIPGVALDQRYDQSSITVADGQPTSPWSLETYTPQARPGHRAPHLFVESDVALYDLFGPGFALLDTSPEEATDTQPDAKRLLDAAHQVGLPIRHVRHAHPDIPHLYQRRYTLVRPDQYVAWSGNTIPAEVDALIARIRGAQPLSTAGERIA